MARIELTDSPVDIIAANSDLDATTVYTVQAEPQFGDLVRISDVDAQPGTDEGLIIKPLEIVRAKAGAGGSLWVWAPGKSPGDQVLINVFEDV